MVDKTLKSLKRCTETSPLPSKKKVRPAVGAAVGIVWDGEVVPRLLGRGAFANPSPGCTLMGSRRSPRIFCSPLLPHGDVEPALISRPVATSPRKSVVVEFVEVAEAGVAHRGVQGIAPTEPPSVTVDAPVAADRTSTPPSPLTSYYEYLGEWNEIGSHLPTPEADPRDNSGLTLNSEIIDLSGHHTSAEIPYVQISRLPNPRIKDDAAASDLASTPFSEISPVPISNSNLQMNRKSNDHPMTIPKSNLTTKKNPKNNLKNNPKNKDNPLNNPKSNHPTKINPAAEDRASAVQPFDVTSVARILRKNYRKSAKKFISDFRPSTTRSS
jgi:hypothetical protein